MACAGIPFHEFVECNFSGFMDVWVKQINMSCYQEELREVFISSAPLSDTATDQIHPVCNGM